MPEFILKYWVEVVFGLIVSGLSFACRRYWKLWRAEQQYQKTEEQKAFYNDILEKIDERFEKMNERFEETNNRITALDNKVEQKINERFEETNNRITALDNKVEKKINEVRKDVQSSEAQQKILKEGLLSVQGNNFKRQCKALLEPTHKITETEWLQHQIDFEAYERLGGNDDGHDLHNAVAHKYYNMD